MYFLSFCNSKLAPLHRAIIPIYIIQEPKKDVNSNFEKNNKIAPIIMNVEPNITKPKAHFLRSIFSITSAESSSSGSSVFSSIENRLNKLVYSS